MAGKSPRLFVIKFLGLWGGANTGPDDKNGVGRKDSQRDLYSTKPVPCDQPTTLTPSTTYEKAIERSTRQVAGFMQEKGAPGLTICVSKNGKTVWHAAFGLCDVENLVPCDPDARMRIASISKSLFATTIIAPMLEKAELDLKASIHKYVTVDEFPKPKFHGQEYEINVEQLLSHTSGIRTYNEMKEEEKPLRPIGSKGSKKIYQDEEQFNKVGFYQRKTYRNVFEALEPFKNDPLASEPGKFFYTTYGYTLLSALAEKVLQMRDEFKNKQIEDFWMDVVRRAWGMKNTSLDQDEPILSNRARYYLRSSVNGALVNAPYTDMSVKWAGGGINSTSSDIVKFANQLIACYKDRGQKQIKKETVELLWKEVKNSYCLGFNRRLERDEKLIIYHTGAAVGASSILMIYPDSEIVVVILCNLGNLNFVPLARSIGDAFEVDF